MRSLPQPLQCIWIINSISSGVPSHLPPTWTMNWSINKMANGVVVLFLCLRVFTSHQREYVLNRKMFSTIVVFLSTENKTFILVDGCKWQKQKHRNWVYTICVGKILIVVLELIETSLKNISPEARKGGDNQTRRKRKRNFIVTICAMK